MTPRNPPHGSSNFQRIVCSSAISTARSGLSQPAVHAPFFGSLIHSICTFTAAALSGSPSENRTPLRSFIRHVSGSGKVHDSASHGTGRKLPSVISSFS